MSTMRELPIQVPEEEIESFCRRWKIAELSLFGSAVRNELRPDSDVDVLVSFGPDARWSLFDVVRMEEELQEILGRKVDLVERVAVERSENYIRRKSILSHLVPVYVAG
jgi:predicted nucleotidyltransferase